MKIDRISGARRRKPIADSGNYNHITKPYVGFRYNSTEKQYYIVVDIKGAGSEAGNRFEIIATKEEWELVWASINKRIDEIDVLAETLNKIS